MQPFEYLAPPSLDEALALLAEHGEEAKVLAGGQSLVPLLNYRLARPRYVVDINGLPLGALAREDGRLRLGALTRHVTLEESPEVGRHCPLLAEAAGLIGNVRVRSLGTLGGSLAHADPAAELPLVMTALEAEIAVAGRRGRRTLPAREFFRGLLSTALAPDELVIHVEVPVLPAAGYAIDEISRGAGDFAMVAVAAVVGVDRQGRVAEARVAISGVGPAPVRIPSAEALLRGHEPTAERLEQAAREARARVDPPSDAFVSGAYRRLLAGVLTRRALARAVTRAMEGR